MLLSIKQYDDRYTFSRWVGCYIWYSEGKCHPHRPLLVHFKISCKKWPIMIYSTRWLYSVEQTAVFGSKAICAQAVYFLHSTMPSVTACNSVMSALSAVLLIYSFQSRPALLPCQSARRHSGGLGLPNIGHRTLLKIWVGCLCGAYSPGE